MLCQLLASTCICTHIKLLTLCTHKNKTKKKNLETRVGQLARENQQEQKDNATRKCCRVLNIHKMAGRTVTDRIMAIGTPALKHKAQRLMGQSEYLNITLRSVCTVSGPQDFIWAEQEQAPQMIKDYVYTGQKHITALSEDPVSWSSTHRTAHNCL